jgi:hypothetical protein
MQTGKPKHSQRRKAGTIPKVSHVRRCPDCQYYAPSGKCLNPTLPNGRCGDWVYYWRNGKQFRRLWTRPRDPRTSRQLLCRERLGAASKRYSLRGLTDSQQDGWFAAGARLRSRPRLFQSGPLTRQQYAVRQECSTKAVVGARSAGTVAKPLQTQGISASTWEHYRSATVAVPWEDHPSRADYHDLARPGENPPINYCALRPRTWQGRAKLPERVPTEAVARRLV